MYSQGSKGLRRSARLACSTAIASSPFQPRTIELKLSASADELESANDRSNAVSAVSKSRPATAMTKPAVASAAASSPPAAIACRAWCKAAFRVSSCNPPLDVFAHGLAIDPDPPRYRRDGQPLAMKIQDHDKLPQLDHRLPLPPSEAIIGRSAVRLPGACPGKAGITPGEFSNGAFGEIHSGNDTRHRFALGLRNSVDCLFDAAEPAPRGESRAGQSASRRSRSRNPAVAGVDRRTRPDRGRCARRTDRVRPR